MRLSSKVERIQYILFRQTYFLSLAVELSFSRITEKSKRAASKLNFAPRRETCPVPAQYQIFTVKTSKMEGMNNDKLFWW